MVTYDRPPWEVPPALANGGEARLLFADASCDELAAFCRGACCTGWDEIPIWSAEERVRLADVTEDARVNPNGIGRMQQVGPDLRCVLNDPVTGRCRRYADRPQACRDGGCTLRGQTFEVVIRRVPHGVRPAMV